MPNKKQKKSSRKMMGNRKNALQAMATNRSIAAARKEQLKKMKQQMAQQEINQSGE